MPKINVDMKQVGALVSILGTFIFAITFINTLKADVKNLTTEVCKYGEGLQVNRSKIDKHEIDIVKLYASQEAIIEKMNLWKSENLKQGADILEAIKSLKK